MLRLVLVLAIVSAPGVDVGTCGDEDEGQSCPPACVDCVACLHGQAFEGAEESAVDVVAPARMETEVALLGSQQVDPRKVRHVPRA